MIRYALGVDLGSTYSAAAVGRGSAVAICALGTTAQQIASIVVLRDDGEILTGEAAEQSAASDPTRTASEFKRRLGDPVPIIVGGTPYGAEALMAHLLRAIVEQVSRSEGGEPAVVVLTHPAGYTDYKLGLLHETARLAGLDLAHVWFLSEPQAAAISYASHERVEAGALIAVCELGRATFDAAVVRRTETGFELLGIPESIEHLGEIDVELPDPRTRKTITALQHSISSAGLTVEQVDRVLLVGGSSHMHVVGEEVRRVTGRPVTVDAHPEFTVAMGAALAAAMVAGDSVVADQTGNQIARTVGLAAAGAVSGGAATLGASAIISEATATAATVAGGAGVGPVGVSINAAAVAGDTAVAGVGPVGVSITAGPVGEPIAVSGPLGEPIGVVRTVPPTSPPTTRGADRAAPNKARLAVRIGAVAGAAAVVVGTVVVIATGGDDRAAPTPITLAPTAVSNVTASTESTPTTTAGGDEEVPVPTAPIVSNSVPSPDSTALAAPDLSTSVPTPAGRGLPGLVAVIAGTGLDDGAGRPGPAEAASLGNAALFAVAPNGEIFVTNHENELLLVSGGQTSVVYVGDSAAGESGFGGVAVGPDGEAYVTMGTGVKRIGRDGSSQLVVDAQALGHRSGFGPITFDPVGNLYFFERSTFRILLWSAGGGLSIVAGTGEQGQIGSAPAGDGGPANAAALTGVNAMVVDAAGHLLVAESGRPVVRRIAPDGTISTFVGGGQIAIRTSLGNYAPDGTLPGDLQFSSLTGVAVDPAGRVYVSDGADHVIVRLGMDGAMELVAADQTGALADFGIPAQQFRAFTVTGLALDRSGNLLFGQANRILSIADASSGG